MKLWRPVMAIAVLGAVAGPWLGPPLSRAQQSASTPRGLALADLAAPPAPQTDALDPAEDLPAPLAQAELDSPLVDQAQAPLPEQPRVEATEPAAAPAEEEAVDDLAPVTDEADLAPPSMDGMITHWPLKNAPIRLVLRQLAMMSQKNIIPSPSVKGEVTTDLFNVTFREALDAILEANGYGYVEKGNFIYVYTIKELAEIEKAQRKTESRLFRLSYVQPEDAQALIGPALSSDALIAITPGAKAGIGTSDSSTGGLDYAADNVLLIRDYPENLDKVAAILREIDMRPAQVLIEATILQATLNEDNVLGVDFSTVAGVDFSQLGATSAGLSNIAFPTVGVDALDDSQAQLGTFFPSPSPGQAGLKFGYIGTDIAVFVKALEAVTDTTVMANPKLLVVNKQRGEVLVGDRNGYLTTVVTETAATQTVEFLETGTTLIVRPYIGNDGYVRMEVHPEVSTGGVDANGLPSETTAEVTTNVMVKDGHTIIIGGLFREETVNQRSQVPLLGNIPYAGTLFRSTGDTTVRNEVIILLTPRIIRQENDEVVSEQYRDDVERMRLGARQQLAWWGRSRLAATHVRNARECLAVGNTEKALWNVEMALSLSPRLLEALELKEQLTNRAIWSNEPRVSSVRWVVQDMVMRELGEDPSLVRVPNKPLDANELPLEVREALGIGLDTPMIIEPTSEDVGPVQLEMAPPDVDEGEVIFVDPPAEQALEPEDILLPETDEPADLPADEILE